MTTTTEEVIYSDFPVDLKEFFPPLSPGYDWTWAWVEEDDNDLPRNTTGWTAEMDLRETANSQLIKKLSTANGGIVNDNAGTFTVLFLGAQSTAISARKLVTTVKVTDNTGQTSNHFKGSIDVEEVVTK